MRHALISVLAASGLSLAACGGAEDEVDTAETSEASAEAATMQDDMAGAEADPANLQAILDHPRRAEDAVRDPFRHPAETLEFFGLERDMTVVEVYPGGGWYTRVIAPYLAAGGGTYYAAMPASDDAERMERSRTGFLDRFGDSGAFGDVQVTTFGPAVEQVTPDGSADMVVTFRNVHNFIFGGIEEAAFEDFYAMLKPGGVFGVVEHRLPEDANPALEESSGYVRETRVIALAEAVGFILEAESQINANPADTADHPFGVWTLPPSSRTEGRDGTTPDGFDAEYYREIGESDRMTLRFRKPDAAMSGEGN